MARKIAFVTINDDGSRDLGKVFRLIEMPASQAEKWAMRAFLALSRAGVDIPENVKDSGLAGIASLGMQALGGMGFADAEALMDDMFNACVGIIPDAKQPAIFRGAGGIGPLVEDDIEEVKTRIRLRAEIFTLHTGFFIPGLPSTWASASPPAA